MTRDSELYELLEIARQVRMDAETVLFELEERPDGSRAATAQLAAELLGREVEEFCYLFDLDRALNLLAENHGLLLDKSHHDGMVEGLPYNLDFYVWHRSNAEENGMFSVDPDTARLGYRYAYGDIVAAAIADLLARALPAHLLPTELSYRAERIPMCDAVILDVCCPFIIGDAKLQLSFKLTNVESSQMFLGDPLPEPHAEDVELTCEYCDEDFEDVCMLWDAEKGTWAPHQLG